MQLVHITCKFLFLIAVFCSCNEQTPKPKLPPPTVSYIVIEKKDVPAEFEFIGVAESSHLVDIRSRVEGYLLEIDYVEGSLVKKGQQLFQIDPKPFQAALDRARAEVDRQKAVLWNATKARERLEPLYAQKAASLRDLDNSIADEMAAIASVQAAQAQVVEAELNLGYTTILSPVDGLSGAAKWRQGALITPQGQDGLLTQVSVVNPIWVNFSVSERDLLRTQTERTKNTLIFPKDDNFTVELTLSDGSKFPFKGTVNFAAPTLQQSTGTMLVRTIFENPNDIIKPGQFLRATLSGAIRPNAIVVPQTAVMQGDKGLYVYVVGNENKVEVRNIVGGNWLKNQWIVSSGLFPGDKVIVNGTSKIQLGQIVNPVEVSDKEKNATPTESKEQQK